MMMNQKDIRDIAAYLGAECAYICKSQFGTFAYSTTVSEFLQVALPNGIEFVNDNISEFAIYLRPIASLTDDEKWQCASLAGHQDRESAYFVIDTQSDLLFYDDASGRGKDLTPVYNPGAIVAYLQSIAVYVPQTIDPQYVELI